METPPLPEAPEQITVSTAEFGSLRKILLARSRRVEEKAKRSLLAVVVTVVVGLVGIILSPYITNLDRQILQSETTRQLIETKRKRVEEIDSALSAFSALSALPIPRLFDVELTADGRVGIAVGWNGTILTTDDSGANWTLRNSPVDTNLFDAALSSDGSFGIAVGLNGTILTTGDSGANWTQQASPSPVWLKGVSVSDDGKLGIVVGDDRTVLRTEDRGATWTRTEIPAVPDDQHRRVDFNAVALAADGEVGIVVGDARTVLTTGDRGAKWSKPQNLPEAVGRQSMDLNAVVFAPDGNSGIAVGHEGQTTILITDDGGTKWTKWTGDSGGIGSLEGVALTADGWGIAVGFGDTVLTTRDYGVNWTRRSTRTGERSSDRISGRPNEDPVLWDVALAADGRMGIAVGEIVPVFGRERENAGTGIIFRTRDGGASWITEGALRSERINLLQEIHDLETGSVGQAQRQLDEPAREPTDEFMTTAPLRLAILVLILFLVQVLVGLSRYNTRLAAFYLARADALLVLHAGADSIPVDAGERLARMFSPDHVDFGRTPKAVAQHALDIARDLWSSRAPPNRRA